MFNHYSNLRSIADFFWHTLIVNKMFKNFRGFKWHLGLLKLLLIYLFIYAKQCMYTFILIFLTKQRGERSLESGAAIYLLMGQRFKSLLVPNMMK